MAKELAVESVQATLHVLTLLFRARCRTLLVLPLSNGAGVIDIGLEHAADLRGPGSCQYPDSSNTLKRGGASSSPFCSRTMGVTRTAWLAHRISW